MNHGSACRSGDWHKIASLIWFLKERKNVENMSYAVNIGGSVIKYDKMNFGLITCQI